MSEATRSELARAVAAALADPFEPREVKFKPQMVKNNRCLAMAYIDARLIQDRLDEVVGVENWRDNYIMLPDGSVQCRLSVRIDGRWITKEDVGSPSDQPDVGDRLKSAFSDALKRAAVKFGIGRYLYRLSAAWVDYDPVKKQIVQIPQLPAFALPKSKATPANKSAPKPQQQSQPAPKEEPKPVLAPKGQPTKPAPANLPANGQELHRRLREYDAKLASQKVCPAGALLSYVTQAGVRAGYAADLAKWTGPAIQFAVDAVREFDQGARQKTNPQPPITPNERQQFDDADALFDNREPAQLPD